MNRYPHVTQKHKSFKRKAYEWAVLTIIGIPLLVIIGSAVIVTAVFMGLRIAMDNKQQ